MKKLFLGLIIINMITGCQSNQQQASPKANQELATLLENYYDERMQLFPLEATVNGDNRFNNLLPADFTDSYRDKLKDFFIKNKDAIKKIDREGLNEND